MNRRYYTALRMGRNMTLRLPIDTTNMQTMKACIYYIIHYTIYHTISYTIFYTSLYILIILMHMYTYYVYVYLIYIATLGVCSQ